MFREPKFYLVLFFLAFLTSTVLYLKQKEELIKCQTDKYHIDGGDIEKARLEYQRDSLQAELFVKSVELGRYEVAFSIFTERNPKASEQFSDIISNETE
jgi:hypothetical protein